MKFLPISEPWIAQTVGLMCSTHASIGGISSAEGLQAACHVATRHGLLPSPLSVVIALDEENRRVAGYLVGWTSRPRLVIALTRHPAGLRDLSAGYGRRLMRRAMKKLGRGAAGAAAKPRVPDPPDLLAMRLPAPFAGRSYYDRGGHIGKAIMIGVSDDYRRRGIGLELFKALYADLAWRGITRLDGTISAHNHASVRLLAAAGWAVERTGGGWFVTRDLVASP